MNTSSREMVMRTCLIVTTLILPIGCSGSSIDTGAQPDTCPKNGIVPPDLRDVERSGEGLVATTFGQYPDRKPDWTNAAGVLSLLKEVWGRTKNACPDLPAGPTASIDDAVAKLNQALPAKDQK